MISVMIGNLAKKDIKIYIAIYAFKLPIFGMNITAILISLHCTLHGDHTYYNYFGLRL